MLRHITATYVCDSCNKIADYVMGNEFGCVWKRLDEIWNEIRYGLKPGWVRDNKLQHYCPDCHMKKEVNRRA